MMSAIASALHLLALAIGLPAIFLRMKALGGTLDAAGIKRVLGADNAWGIAALLWITTGPWRAFGPLEKGTEFYTSSHLFWTKLGLFGVIFLLELWPMITFMRWRRDLRAGRAPDTTKARALRLVSLIQAHIVLLIVFVAAFMARGFGR